MGFNPKNKKDIAQLSKSAGYSRGQLGIFRTNRLSIIRQWVGKHYSANGAGDKVSINLFELAFNIYLQRLVAQNPAVDITTDVMKLKEICTRFEMSGNNLIGEIDLGKTLEMAVVGAMISGGFVKVGMNLTKVEVGGYLHDTGQPFADYVSLDDWVHDMTVDRMENVQYEGNYYYPTFDEALIMFPGKEDLLIKREEQQEKDRDHHISETGKNQREEFRLTIKLLDLWLPKQNLFLICQASDDEADPIAEVLKIVEWGGPERGPYHKLGFTEIENNTMALAPAMHWKDLHTLANKLFNKLGRQADRQKTITGVRVGSKDGSRVVDASDGDTIALDDPNSTKEFNYGGIDPRSLAFLLQVKDLFVYLAGNLDMLGGLGPQSETLGQDQLLSISASMRIQRMQKKTIEFTQGILEDLMSYLWYDPYTPYTLTKRVKGFDDVTVQVPFGPEQRESDFTQFNIKIVPYSMQHQTPESKLQGLRTIFAEFVAPLLPMMSAQGVSLNLEMLFRKLSKLSNIPELNDIISYTNPNYIQEPVGQMPQKAPVTTRRYERVNRPGATNQGKSQILQQALLGNKSQQSEIASLMRTTG